MLWLRKLSKQVTEACNDRGFMNLIGGVEGIVSRVLSIAMVVVILVSVVDLILILSKELFASPFGFFNSSLIEIFGLFLNILIALELLENITAYLQKHVIQVELVIVTSLIAVARKLIILDLTKTSAQQLIGLGVAVLALSISYWIIRRSGARNPH